jgi:hypothetical protein
MSNWLKRSEPAHHIGYVIVPLILILCMVSISVADEEDLSPWRTEDLIDDRIEEHAQYALMRMFDGEFQELWDASAMLSAIKSEQLAGIYQVNRKVPALRADAIGTGYWTIIPEGFDAVCWREPEDKLPMIVYREAIGPYRDQLALALRSAWFGCGIPPAFPKPYMVTITKPPPDPPPPSETESAPATSWGATLVVNVKGAGGVLLKGATVIAQLSEGEPREMVATDGGVNYYFTTAPGSICLFVYGPTEGPLYVPYALPVNLMSGSNLAIQVSLTLMYGQPSETACDTDKYHEVFNPCSAGAMSETAKCSEDAASKYSLCAARENPADRPACTASEFAKMQICFNMQDPKRKLQECTDRANRESGCSFPAP